MSRRSILARLARLEAKLPAKPETGVDDGLFEWLTMRELERSIRLAEAARVYGREYDEAEEEYLDTLDERARTRAKAPYAEDVQALLRQEYLLGPVEELPSRYPGFRHLTHPLVEALFREPAQRLSVVGPWAELFPELP